MKKRIVYLFPGQGAQYPGMGRDFFDAFPKAKETFQEADDILQVKLSSLIFEGPQERLTETFNSQLGIFVTSVALMRVLEQEMRIAPAVCSGLSLGEYTALFASKRLGFRETLLLVRERAKLVNEACLKTKGSMAAVLGLDDEKVEALLKGEEGVWVANYNTPGQVVISGIPSSLEKASLLLKEQGAKRVLPLTVQGAFHSPLMASAQEALAPHILSAKIAESPIHLVMNVPGKRVDDVADIQQNLISQVTSSVKWHQGISSIEQVGVDLYLEIGPGKALTGMNRKIQVGSLTLSLEKVQDLDEIAKKMDLVTHG